MKQITPSTRSAAAVLVALLACAAQAADAPPVGDGSLQLQWKQVLEYGGWVLYIVGGLSIFAVANVLTLFVTLRTGWVVPRLLVKNVVTKVRDGFTEDALSLCEDRPCAFASVATAAIQYAQDNQQSTQEQIKDLLVGEGTRQATKLQGSTQWLVDVAAVAPMIGLLGTVLGMLTAFSAVAGEVAAAKPVLLAQGIARALVTTIAGLMVAIPAHMFYAWFRRCANRLTAQLEIAAHELLNALLTNRRNQLGSYSAQPLRVASPQPGARG